jgi:hypothetical protein
VTRSGFSTAYFAVAHAADGAFGGKNSLRLKNYVPSLYKKGNKMAQVLSDWHMKDITTMAAEELEIACSAHGSAPDHLDRLLHEEQAKLVQKMQEGESLHLSGSTMRQRNAH